MLKIQIEGNPVTLHFATEPNTASAMDERLTTRAASDYTIPPPRKWWNIMQSSMLQRMKTGSSVLLIRQSFSCTVWQHPLMQLFSCIRGCFTLPVPITGEVPSLIEGSLMTRLRTGCYRDPRRSRSFSKALHAYPARRYRRYPSQGSDRRFGSSRAGGR